MLVPSPKYRRPINHNQLKLLNLCYKFRFVTSEQIARLQNKNRSTIYESLYVLGRQGYVLKRYDSSYKQIGQPASYCLSAQGIRYLIQLDSQYHKRSTLLDFYRNPSISDEKISAYSFVFDLFLILKKQTGQRFSVYTQYEFDRSLHPNSPPLLKLEDAHPKNNDFVLDFIEAYTPTWQIRRRIRHHEARAKESEYLYPNVLFIAGNESTEKRLFKLTDENYNDFDYSLTQLSMLLSSKDGVVWIDMDASDDENFIRTTLK